jgi:hypothetical protein
MGRSSCRVSAVVGLCMALAATATAFVTPGAAMTRKQRSNPASRLFMAADEKETPFFANQASKTTVEPEKNGESKAAPESATVQEPETYRELKLSELVQPKANVESKAAAESTTAFDPFQVSSDGNQLEQVNLNGVAELKQEQDKQEIGIWAARGILLLVAAIWGTNFAVRAYLLRLRLASAGLMFTFFAEPFAIPISLFFFLLRHNRASNTFPIFAFTRRATIHRRKQPLLVSVSPPWSVFPC